MGRLKGIALTAKNFVEDGIAYLKHSGTLDPYRDRETARAFITKHYHSIEKGLCLPQPRPGFGAKPLTQLMEEIRHYCSVHGPDDVIRTALGALRAYREFHTRHPHPNPKLLESIGELLDKYGSAGPDASEGGTIPVSRESVMEQGRIDFAAFTSSRYSIRIFSGEKVDRNLILEAVRIAQKTPSVCNRQPWRVHDYSMDDAKAQVLKYQNGNRGFGDKADRLLIVTTDYRAFAECTERNEAYVDGGMFAMSLVYALHSLGLGSCCLNLCVQPRTARDLRRVAGIPDNEVLVMVIAVGHLPPSLAVAKSMRRPAEDLVVFH